MAVKYIFILMLILIPGVAAETGIVLNASDYVQYKYDTETRPALQEGEYIIAYQDINSVLKDAKYDGVSFINPEPALQPQYEEKLVATTGLDTTTQAAISAITGAGAAYLVVRRKKQ